jgi:hypothetical protein
VPASKSITRYKSIQSNGLRPSRIYKPMARTKITNGVRILPNVDGRTFWVRRFRDLIALHTSDLGGSDQVSAAEQSIIRRVACLSVELERMEMMFAQHDAEPWRLEVYSRMAGNLRRLLESVGLQRRAKPVQTLQDYLAANEAAR